MKHLCDTCRIFHENKREFGGDAGHQNYHYCIDGLGLKPKLEDNGGGFDVVECPEYTNRIKPIETYYNGYRFRSRLEARWAVFFDALGMKYEYEPQGFDLGNGLYYLPDFLLHNVITRYAQGGEKIDIFVEVKGIPNEKDAQKIERFAQKYPIWVVGELPRPDNYVAACEKQRDDFCESYEKPEKRKYNFPDRCVFCPYDHGMIDGDMCFSFSLGFNDNTLSFHGNDSSYGYGEYYPEIENALRIARQARFEHGETPNTNNYKEEY